MKAQTTFRLHLSIFCPLWLIVLGHAAAVAKPVHHYVFFDLDRERITEESFLSTKAFEGAQQLYRDAIITNMKALKRAFPKSVVMQYANFMPGEWLPGDDKSYLRSVYKAARESGVAVGGPDLLPFKRAQLNSSYPLIKESSGLVPTGVAVQQGNYAEKNPANGRRLTIAELLQFATDTLEG